MLIIFTIVTVLLANGHYDAVAYYSVNDYQEYGNEIENINNVDEQQSIFSQLALKFSNLLDNARLTIQHQATMSKGYNTINSADVNVSALARHKRSARRSFIVKCCGLQSCSEGSKENYERRMDQKRKTQEEVEVVNELQYTKRKKRRKKKPTSGLANLDNLHAYGVFTDAGIHISCAGCPAGWPDMLTVYPEQEVGIPVTCSNCPLNWPGALNLLGVGGDPSWIQGTGSNRNSDRDGARFGSNSFMDFDTDSNFGSNPSFKDGFQPSDGGQGSNEYDDQDETTEFVLRLTTSKTKRGKTNKGVSVNATEITTTTQIAEEDATTEEEGPTYDSTTPGDEQQDE